MNHSSLNQWIKYAYSSGYLISHKKIPNSKAHSLLEYRVCFKNFSAHTQIVSNLSFSATSEFFSWRHVLNYTLIRISSSSKAYHCSFTSLQFRKRWAPSLNNQGPLNHLYANNISQYSDRHDRRHLRHPLPSSCWFSPARLPSPPQPPPRRCMTATDHCQLHGR